MEIINENGLEGIGDAVTILINEAMKIERFSVVLGAKPWERTESGTGYANGFKNKSVVTKFGKLHLNVPQVRGDVDFYPTALKKGICSEKALKLAMAEMYIQGVSTRKVTEVLKKLCGLEISSTQVSNASKLLDKELGKWLTRPLGKIPFLQLDARYEKIRQDDRRTALGTSISLSEAEVH